MHQDRTLTGVDLDMHKIAGVLFGLSLFILTIVGWRSCVADIAFEQGCEGHLKRAADASTIETAKTELNVALGYMVANKLTSGYTSVVYNTPNEDIEFWYKNLVAARKGLEEVSLGATPLERSNVLLKLRETLLDHTQNGEMVTMPNGIARFPYNTSFYTFAMLALALTLIGVGLFMAKVFIDTK